MTETRGDNYCLRNKWFPLKWVKTRAHSVWKTSLCSCGKPEADHSCPQKLHKFSLRCLWNKLATKGLHPEQTLPMTSLSFSTGAFKNFKKCVWLFCLCIMCPVWYLQKGQEKSTPQGTTVTDGCNLPCGCGELNPGSLEGQPVLSTSE